MLSYTPLGVSLLLFPWQGARMNQKLQGFLDCSR
jgi:hypothetical protein